MSINNEDYKKQHVIKGEISMVMHKGGEYNPKTGKIEGAQEITKEQKTKNLIVNKASELMAWRMAPTMESETGTTVSDLQKIIGLQVLAVGVGILEHEDQPYDRVNNKVNTVLWDIMDPELEHKAQLTDTRLVGELYRKKFTSWCFVDENDEPQNYNTNILKLVTTFNEDEAVGPITEMAIFGGNASEWNK